MIIDSRATTPAPDSNVAAAVTEILERRAAMMYPPTSLAISDAVALGIAGQFSSNTLSGRVLERFYRTGSADSDDLIKAASMEQGFASAEGHAALYCLIGWVRSRVQRLEVQVG
jgi:hypothetical protein